MTRIDKEVIDSGDLTVASVTGGGPGFGTWESGRCGVCARIRVHTRFFLLLFFKSTYRQTHAGISGLF